MNEDYIEACSSCQHWKYYKGEMTCGNSDADEYGLETDEDYICTEFEHK